MGETPVYITENAVSTVLNGRAQVADFVQDGTGSTVLDGRAQTPDTATTSALLDGREQSTTFTVDSSPLDARAQSPRYLHGLSWHPGKLAGLFSWVRSDKLVTTVGGKVSAWGDLSGHGHGVAQGTDTLRPVYVASGGVNGLPYLDCGASGANSLDFAAGSFASLTSAEAFIFGHNKRVNEATLGGLWVLGANTVGGGTLFPYVDGSVYEAAFSVGRYNAAFHTGGATLAPFCYDVAAGSALTCYLNGVQKFATANTFAVNAAPRLLCSDAANTVSFLGFIYEFILFSRLLAPSERALITAYGKARYSIT